MPGDGDAMPEWKEQCAAGAAAETVRAARQGRWPDALSLLRQGGRAALEWTDPLSGDTLAHLAARDDRADVLGEILALLGQPASDGAGVSSVNAFDGSVLRTRNFANRSPLQEAKAAGGERALQFLASALHSPAEQLFFADDSFENMVRLFEHAGPHVIDERLECYNRMTWAALCVEEGRYPELRWLHGRADFTLLDECGNSFLHLVQVPCAAAADSAAADCPEDGGERLGAGEEGGESGGAAAPAAAAASALRARFLSDDVTASLTSELLALGPLDDEFNAQERHVLYTVAFLLSLRKAAGGGAAGGGAAAGGGDGDGGPEALPVAGAATAGGGGGGNLASAPTAAGAAVGSGGASGAGGVPEAPPPAASAVAGALGAASSVPLFDVSQRNASGSTAAHSIGEQHSSNPALAWRLLRLLRAHGADFDARDGAGQTVAMVVAAASGDGPWLAWLLDPEGGCCDPDATDAKGRRVEDHVVVATLDAFDEELDVDEEYEEGEESEEDAEAAAAGATAAGATAAAADAPAAAGTAAAAAAAANSAPAHSWPRPSAFAASGSGGAPASAAGDGTWDAFRGRGSHEALFGDGGAEKPMTAALPLNTVQE